MLWGWAPLLRKSSRRVRVWAVPGVYGGLDVVLPVSIHTQSVTRYTVSVYWRQRLQPNFCVPIALESCRCQMLHALSFPPHKSLVFQLRSLYFCILQSFDNTCMWGALLTGFG